MQREGLSAALTLVVAAAVLIVVALIVISMTSGGLSKFFRGTEQASQANIRACQSCIYSYCAGHVGDSTSSTSISTVVSGFCKEACSKGTGGTFSCTGASTCYQLIVGGKPVTCQ